MSKKIEYQNTADGRPVAVVTLTNAAGVVVVLQGVGAGIQKVIVPDAKGNMADVALGYNNVDDYFADGPCAGKVPGRYANRIARGHFSLDGKEYTLPINNGPNHLHGGPEGFQNQIWTLEHTDDDSASFVYVSREGEAGYPGQLTARACYRLTDDNSLELTLEATTTAPTVVNLTNHAYWNLSGHNSGSVLGHNMQLAASRYLPTDDTLIPEGAAAEVAGTPMDFTVEKTLGQDIKLPFPALIYGKGYDNCWLIDDYRPGTMRTAARLIDPISGRVLTVVTDMPAVQVYTGNWLAGSPANKEGRSYDDYDGVAIECQDCPDAPNKETLPTTVLRPGEKYCRHISFKFSTK